MIGRRATGFCIAAALMALVTAAQAAQLDPAKWTVTELGTGKDLTKEVTDNDPETAWTDPGGKGLLVDLGQAAVIHRIYLTPGANAKERITAVRIAFLRQPDEVGAVTRNYGLPKCDWSQAPAERAKLRAKGTDDFLPGETDANLKFDPHQARYLRIEGPSKIAELEVYGSQEKDAFEKRDAVVVAANAPELLRLAAEDLRYYIGELTGRPLPIVEPAQAEAYPGALYRIEDLKPFAGTYEEMLVNLRAGKLPSGGPLPDTVVSLYTERLPDGVNVEREGRAVVFRAWPYRNVLYSVWEFLRRQGVVWAYPGNHGDLVPAGKGVDLGILPLRFRPSAERRRANFEVGSFKEYPYIRYPYTEDFLFFARNGYECSWGVMERFLGQHQEVPPIPQLATRTEKEVPPEYKEGFTGYPHNFSAVIPNRILEQHPDWCGMNPDGKRLPPSRGGPATFCMTSPGAIEFVAGKMLAWVGDANECVAKFSLLPMDATQYCQCEACLGLYKPYERPEIPYVPGMPYMVSDAYYHFVAEVAKRVGAKAPKVRVGVLAYADVHAPPRKIDQLPANVWVEVCQYGSRNLPMTSPANAAMRQCTETWARKCAHLENYEYQLIEGEWMELPMPVPSVRAIADRSKFLHRLGAWNGGTQSWTHSLPHNPWNHYAYVRMLWDVSQTADRILDEFFTAYYREAKEPMLAYYRTLEDHLVRNHVDLQNFAYDQGPNPDAFPPEIVATLRPCLEQARKSAKSWWVKPRVEAAIRDLEWAVPASLRRSLDKPTALKYGKREYVCARRRGEIKIDGRLDDEGWKAAPAAGGFIKPKTHEPVPAEAQTEFRMVWDDDHLYVAVTCRNKDIAAMKETDAIWGANTDSLEWHLAPERAYTAAYYQVAVSAFNRTFGPGRCFHDQWHKEEWKTDGFRSAVQRGDGVWTCEMALPLKALKEGAPKAGGWWRVNLARNYAGGSSWSPLQVGAWMLYRDFNLVTFAGEP